VYLVLTLAVAVMRAGAYGFGKPAGAKLNR